jgi:hypothetical protein
MVLKVCISGVLQLGGWEDKKGYLGAGRSWCNCFHLLAVDKDSFTFKRFRLHSTSQQTRQLIAERVAVLISLWLV